LLKNSPCFETVLLQAKLTWSANLWDGDTNTSLEIWYHTSSSWIHEQSPHWEAKKLASF